MADLLTHSGNGSAAPLSQPTRCEESKITIHAVLAAYGRTPAGLDLLHRDLYDSRTGVAKSALQAVAAITDQRSLPHAVKLLTSSDRQVRLEAVRAVGAFKVQAAGRVLSGLYRTAHDDELRCETLKSLARIMPSNAALLRVLQERVASPVSSPELRACCSLLLIEVSDPQKLAEVLQNASEESLQAIVSWASDRPEISGRIIQHELAQFGRLTAASRASLVDVAASSSVPEATEVIQRGLDDGDLDVRSSAYRAIARMKLDRAAASAIVERLMRRTERSYLLEEEALAAMDHVEESFSGGQTLDSQTMSKLRKASLEMFNLLSAKQDRVGSEKIELGWLLIRSREYLEFYASEEFRQALINYLKGGSYYTGDELLRMLKKTAERVEVGHFEGFRALAEIINDRKRPGMALILRELSITKLGKWEQLGRLIRSLRLMRLAVPPGREVLSFAAKVFVWARQAKLFRLAEAGLSVIARFDPTSATTVCRELLTPPIESKILAIATARLMKELEKGALEPTVAALLGSGADTHIMLNLVDALATVELSASPSLLPALISLVRGATDIEVARRAAQSLALRPSSTLFEPLTEDFESLEARHQEVVIDLVAQLFEELASKNAEGLTEFLYGVLRRPDGSFRGTAAVLLWRLGDDYAPKVVRGFLEGDDNELRIAVLRALEGRVDVAMARELLALVDVAHAGLQEALRATLLSVRDEAAAKLIVDALTGREGTGDEPSSNGENESSGVTDDELRIEAGVFRERQAFRFEHEFIRDLAVLFTDIQGYSAKAQSLTTMQITTLIQDYEAILLPTMESHRGKLIKRMGDGHLFIFESVLDAGLAGVRLQKALKRFNSYREERLRVVVRVGIHWGKVVQRDGDVLGNNVNIASRLESSAKGGTVLVSQAAHDRMEGHVHARGLGQITVKNISEPISVYELSEIQIDLPDELDPLKTASASASGGQSATAAQENPASDAGAGEEDYGDLTIGSGVVKFLSKIFTDLDDSCARAERGETTVSDVRRQLAQSWGKFRNLAMGAIDKNDTT